MKKLPKTDDCTACSACVTACAHKALELALNKNGYFEVITDSSKCTNCGLCEKVSPVLRPIKKTEYGTTYYACWNTNSEVREKSASGGAFSALALYVLNQGGIVYGAAISGFDIVHKRIDNISALSEILGSKYQQGNICGIYKQVRQDLLKGKIVLFSGMACQIAGLISYLGTTEHSNLFTVDTICGGFSTVLPMLCLKDSGKYNGIYSFRDKNDGWSSVGFKYNLRMQKCDGSIEDLKLDNLVLNTFSSKLLKRGSCCNCAFTSPYRQSDVTIGDFWGDQRFKVQHSNGLSVIAIHSKRIMEIIKGAPLHIEPITFDELISSNHNYYWTRFPLVRFFISRKLALWALRSRKTRIAAWQIKPKSLAGICMSVYLKLNKRFLRVPFYKNLKSTL